LALQVLKVSGLVGTGGVFQVRDELFADDGRDPRPRVERRSGPEAAFEVADERLRDAGADRYPGLVEPGGCPSRSERRTQADRDDLRALSTRQLEAAGPPRPSEVIHIRDMITKAS
jgi:hypothetical protein